MESTGQEKKLEETFNNIEEPQENEEEDFTLNPEELVDYEKMDDCDDCDE